MHRVALAAVVLGVVAACSGDKSAAPATSAPPSTAAAAVGPDVATGCFTFEEADRGASVTVYAVRDCDGRPLTIGGSPAALPVGGTVTHGQGLACTDRGALVVKAANSDDGVTYQAVDTTYQIDGTALVEVDETSSTIDAAEVAPYYELDCPIGG